MKVTKLLRLTAVVLVVLFILAGYACKEAPDYVVYEVTGNADLVDITITNESGGSAQYNDVPLPWRMDFGGFEYSQPYIYVHNNTEDAATITANIYLNGKMFKSGTSYGPYCTLIVLGDK